MLKSDHINSLPIKKLYGNWNENEDLQIDDQNRTVKSKSK